MATPSRSAGALTLRSTPAIRLRRLGGGLRSWLAVRWTRTAALYLTAPPSEVSPESQPSPLFGGCGDLPPFGGSAGGKASSSTAPAVLLIGLAALALPACADPARERFGAAEKALLEQRMETALGEYRSIPKDFPQSRYAPAALLRQGELYGVYYRNYPAAIEAYESLVFNYPRSAEAPRAMLRQAEIHHLHYLDHTAAVEELEAIRSKFPRFAEMDQVLLLLAKSYAGIRDTVRETAALAALIESFPESSSAAEGRWMMAFSLLGQGKFSEADREFRKLYYLATDRKSKARARWGMAQALEGQGQLAAAVEQYEAIRDDWEDPAYTKEKIARLRRRMEER